MLPPDFNNYPIRAYPHLLPDVLSPCEWRSWRRMFLISTIRAFKEFYSSKLPVDIIRPESFLLNLLDKPSYRCKEKVVYLYIVQVDGYFDWDYLVPIETPIASQPWVKWRTETKKKNLSFYKYGLTKHPDIITRDIVNYKKVIDFAEVPIETASWSEFALPSRLFFRQPKSFCTVNSGIKRDGTLQGLNKSFVGYTETFNFTKSPDLLRGLCGSTVRRVYDIYEMGGDDALLAYSYSASCLEGCLQRLIHKKLLRLSYEYSNRCGPNAGKSIPAGVEDELEWALSTRSHEVFHKICLPFIKDKCERFGLNRLFSDEFLIGLDSLARKEASHN